MDTGVSTAATTRKAILGEIKTVEDFAKRLEGEAGAYRDSLSFIKTVTPGAITEEEGLVLVYKNFILEERRPEQLGDQPPPASALEAYRKARKEAVLEPRLMSVSGYQDLFELALANSSLRKRQDNTDEEIKHLKQEIAALKVRDTEL